MRSTVGQEKENAHRARLMGDDVERRHTPLVASAELYYPAPGSFNYFASTRRKLAREPLAGRSDGVVSCYVVKAAGS